MKWNQYNEVKKNKKINVNISLSLLLFSYIISGDTMWITSLRRPIFYKGCVSIEKQRNFYKIWCWVMWQKIFVW